MNTVDNQSWHLILYARVNYLCQKLNGQIIRLLIIFIRPLELSLRLLVAFQFYDLEWPKLALVDSVGSTLHGDSVKLWTQHKWIWSAVRLRPADRPGIYIFNGVDHYNSDFRFLWWTSQEFIDHVGHVRMHVSILESVWTSWTGFVKCMQTAVLN